MKNTNIKNYKSSTEEPNLVVLPKIYIETRPKCTKQWTQSSAVKQALETLLLSIEMCTGLTKDITWIN